ncbi:MAG: dihydrofolate reductase [Lachnospiraceae bacterium]|nr:dihydrofolate reductase [Lachnospiraceae bacterium]
MNLIVAVDKNWAIGNKGKLLVSIPGDQKMFREETMGKVIVMGRKTLESLPSGQPLMGRTNVVLTRNESFNKKGTVVFHTVEETLEYLKQFRPEDVYIIGGEEIYRQFLPYCDTAHVTWIDYAYEADTHFPNLDKDPEWHVTDESDEQTYFNLCYEFRKYERK